ncbi:preprotein translocase subunit SecY, partial [Bradyrhizobium sp.]|uniref:preprotein translocase subunit SecY n=1 Tax=Bradyrhizobium sp. TaxID=376 RepID=UPI003C75FB4A
MKSELARRIAFTLGALLVYRLGTYIPLPGIDPDIWEQVFESQAGGILGVFNILAGGGIHRMAIFALNIMPYFSAAILIQLVSMVSPKLNALSRGGEAGRRKIARYTIALAISLAAFQAFGIASGLQNVPNLVGDPGGLFLLSAAVTLTGGMVLLIWLSEQITVRGIGNGLALLIFASVAVEMPRAVAEMLELTRQGALSTGQASLLAILSVAMVGLVVFVELARRRVPLEFAARKIGKRSIPAQSSYLPLKLNSSGVIPTIMAPWLLLPLLTVGLVLGQTSWLDATISHLRIGQLGHMIFSSIAIIILAFIYTSFVIDPEHAADSLKKGGAVIPGIEPGEPTAEHLDRIVSYTTCIGSLYLAAVFLIPELWLSLGQVPFYLGGASVLVVVCTVLDIETQV